MHLRNIGKRIVSVLICGALAAGGLLTAKGQETPAPVPARGEVQGAVHGAVRGEVRGAAEGDVNGDGTVNISDVMACCKLLADKSAEITPEQMARADVNGDGALTITDVMWICKILAQKGTAPRISIAEPNVSFWWNGAGVAAFTVENLRADTEWYAEYVSESRSMVLKDAEFDALEGSTLSLYVAGCNPGTAVMRVGLRNKDTKEVYDTAAVTFRHEEPNIDSMPIPVDTVKDIQSLANYLGLFYGVLWTDMQAIQLSYKIRHNTSSMFPYDYEILIDYDISLYDLKYSMLYTEEQKRNTIEKMRLLQKQIYEIVDLRFPNSKFVGSFYHSYYKYPSIQEGYESIRFMTWANYTTLNPLELLVGDYYEAKLSGFRWDDTYDDYIF